VTEHPFSGARTTILAACQDVPNGGYLRSRSCGQRLQFVTYSCVKVRVAIAEWCRVVSYSSYPGLRTEN
jgi:hypothetical protein